MAARGNLLRSLQDLDAAGSNERKMARLKSGVPWSGVTQGDQPRRSRG